jgi:hypothetical protein
VKLIPEQTFGAIWRFIEVDNDFELSFKWQGSIQRRKVFQRLHKELHGNFNSFCRNSPARWCVRRVQDYLHCAKKRPKNFIVAEL